MVRPFCTALLAAAAVFIFSALPASAAPALFLVQSPTAKVYLFGTIHMLREGTPWRTPELEAAIAESRDLYLEIAIDPTNVKQTLPSIVKLGFDREHPLSTKISKPDVELLDEIAKRYGMPGEQSFEPMQPWMVWLMLSLLPASHSGYSGTKGVDVNVRKDFVAAGKPVLGFETFEGQEHLFADLPQAQQVAMLDLELKTLGKPQTAGVAGGTAKLDAMVDAWMSGDEERLATVNGFQALQKSSMYGPLIADRNKAWAAILADRLKGTGTSFVSVGALHLVGPDGVPALLEKMGFKVSRVTMTDVPVTPSPQPGASAEPSPSASPAASPTPIPQTLVPPAGWKPRPVSPATGSFKIDAMWADPARNGVLLTGHMDMPSQLGRLDLDSLDELFHQGLIGGAGAKNVQASTHVKICGGKQDGTYTKVRLAEFKEDIVLAVSDRGYVAQYVRRLNATDDPAAQRALLTMCAP